MTYKLKYTFELGGFDETEAEKASSEGPAFNEHGIKTGYCDAALCIVARGKDLDECMAIGLDGRRNKHLGLKDSVLLWSLLAEEILEREALPASIRAIMQTALNDLYETPPKLVPLTQDVKIEN